MSIEQNKASDICANKRYIRFVCICFIQNFTADLFIVEETPREK
jgi:hypothetical protein